MSSPAALPTVQIRRARPEDAPACGRIFFEAFAKINTDHGFPPEVPSVDMGRGAMGMLFSHPLFYCVVAEENGTPVGSNCLDERSRIAGLGPITIDPAAQNRGIGRALMLAVLERYREQGFAGVRLLQSAFHCRSLSLYAKLGFEVREPIAVMSGHPAEQVPEGYTVRPGLVSDEAQCAALCERVHGFVRSGEITEALQQSSIRVVERNGRLTRYTTGYGYFGHAAAETTDDIKALIAAADHVSGPGILVPMRNTELFRWCLQSGMRLFQPMNLMTIGLYNEPRGAYLPSILY